ncbi:hypothetical protein BDN72DRAFT_781336, partial [Pluteus cervinus]
NDFLREFVPRQDTYMCTFLESEAPQGDSCSVGCGRAMAWRCTSCLGNPQYCAECLGTTHARLPFHRVERWCGPETYFQSSWLRYAGITIPLAEGAEATGNPDEEEDDWVDETESVCGELEDTPDDPGATHHHDSQGNPILTVVDVTGIHRLSFITCRCADAPEFEIQLLRMGFLPGSYQHIRTVFTTHVLDDFLQDNQEAHTSGYAYFEKLRRRTSSAFPDRTPNRYRELLRISRQWRLLKHKKWHTFGHTGHIPKEGELALFCPTCPQAGINIPDSWADEPNQHLYMRSFVVDGNFTASHLKQKNPEDDVRLTDGTGMMANRSRYQEHLKVAHDDKDINDCNATRALNVKVSKRGTTATGIGATACARHGCFAPCSCVDFQKGERQANIDYSLSQAGKHSNLDRRQYLLWIYDAICQLCKKMKVRFKRNKFLGWPKNPVLYNAIGSFHVRGHVSPCFQRYGLLFVPGAGLIDGEVIETLWSKLNHVSPSTRGASEAHRDEILSDQMSYSNWKKCIMMGPSICRKHRRALGHQAAAAEAFTRLDAKITAHQRKEWRRKSDEAQTERFKDVKAMDWFAPDVGKDPGREAIEVLLLRKEKKAKSTLKGIASLVSECLVLEEAQLQLRQHMKALPEKPTRKQTIEIFRRRNTLDKKIQAVHSKLMPVFTAAKADDVDKDVDWEDEPDVEPEHQQLLLPSSIGIDRCTSSKMKGLVDVEIKLRCGQANDALEHLRLELGRKAFLHVKKRTTAVKKIRLRGWAAIHTAEDKIAEYTAVYRRVRNKLVDLGASAALLLRYQELTDDHLTTSTTLLDTQTSHQRHKTLPWIWGSETGTSGGGDAWGAEFKRSHWLRANEQLKRANEEVLLLRHEMSWTVNFFRWKARIWDKHTRGKELSEGHRCYARRQRAMWLEMAENTEGMFQQYLASPSETNK